MVANMVALAAVGTRENRCGTWDLRRNLVRRVHSEMHSRVTGLIAFFQAGSQYCSRLASCSCCLRRQPLLRPSTHAGIERPYGRNAKCLPSDSSPLTAQQRFVDCPLAWEDIDC